MFPRCSFDTFALVRACGAGGNAHKQRQLPKTTDTSCECAAGGVPKLSTVVLPILLLLWRVTGTMRSIEFPTPCLQIPIPGDLIGQPFLLRRLGNDRQTLLCAVSIRLQQEALVTPLNNFNAGWLLRHHRICDGTRSYSIVEFSSVMALAEIANTIKSDIKTDKGISRLSSR